MSLSNPKATGTPDTTAPRASSASTAVFLTWFAPGAGHLMLGRIAPAVFFFVLVEGLYVLGWFLSEGMAFRFLDPELRTSKLAPILSPEVGNLGAFLYQLRNAFGDGEPTPWPAHIRLGSSLCAMSGVLNAVAMVHAHTVARAVRERDALMPTVAVAATWFVPGLGHVLTGRRLRGLIVFVMLVGLFVLGTYLAEGANLSRERHFYYWAGQFLVGLPALAAEALFGDMRVTSDIPYRDAGLVFGCIAGLLNVLVMVDAYAGAEERELGLSPEPAATPEESSSEPSPSPAAGAPSDAQAGAPSGTASGSTAGGRA